MPVDKYSDQHVLFHKNVRLTCPDNPTYMSLKSDQHVLKIRPTCPKRPTNMSSEHKNILTNKMLQPLRCNDFNDYEKFKIHSASYLIVSFIDIFYISNSQMDNFRIKP